MRSFTVAFAMMLALATPGAAALAADAAPADPVLETAAGLGGIVMFVDSGAPGLVLALVRGEHSLVLGYGETTKGNGHTPDGSSLLRLNSITKVFATDVLDSMVADGTVRLTDPLQRWSGGVAVPTFEGRPITLLNLATHTAALPREMGDLPDGANPRAWPTHADRWAWLPGYHLPWAPGSIASYSNIGFDLLADALETAGGKPYPELLRARVTGPLGMADTTFAPDAAQCARLMTGSGLGGALPCGNTQATGGSGGLYSTADDMVRWLRHTMADPDGTLALSHAAYYPRQALLAAIGFDEAGPMQGIGLGWVTVAAEGIRPTLIAKSGGGAGFMSYVAFVPGRDVGLFVAVNRVDFAMFHTLTSEANALISNLVTR